MNRIFKNVAIYLLIVLAAYFIFSQINVVPQKEDPFNNNYTAFYKALEKGEIKNITIIQGDDVRLIKGTLNNTQQFEVVGPPNDEKLIELIKSKDIIFSQEQAPKTSIWTTLLTSFLPFLLLIGFMFFMIQQTQGGGSRVMQFGKSRARLHTDDKKRITFADVAGVDEVKEELAEIVDFLKSPKKYTELGAKIPKGVLLFGPPGTGKTLLARAIAGESGVPFFSISGSDFVEMFVGVGASRVRDLFEQAKKNAPCIVFIDEIDAVGRQRGAGLGGGHDEREQTLNQLLVEMDGFSVNAGIIIVAATNRPDILDPALLRPGRFDRQIVVDIPDVKGRQEILKVHAKGKPLQENVDLDILARRTPGFTGADLANLFNEAALLAARRNYNKISMSELEDSIERVIAGPEKKSRVISDFEKKLVSYHEAGHGLVAALLPHTDPLHKISIIPRGRAGGYTLLLPKEDRHYMTRSHLLNQVTMLLGGRMAEKLVLNEISTGAQNDLERATGIVRKMITEFGMSEELGPLTFGKKQEQVFLGRDIATDRNYSEEVAYAIDKEARRIIDDCYKEAEKLLKENIEALHRIAETLMQKETIDAEEFAELLQQAGLGEFVEERIASSEIEKEEN
ncbi:MAG: ATP-dependent zinc metalloprotease FtsH [Peptococcia bacterium]